MNGDYDRERGNPAVAACQVPVGTRFFDINLAFAGEQLQLRYGPTVRTYRAVSGGTSKKYKPIPKGRYWIQPAELWSRGFMTNATLCIASLASDLSCREMVEQHTSAWGDYRLTIHPYPGTNMGNRGGFFIHGGKTLDSAGCIDLAGSMNRFVADLESALGDRPATCYIDLEVR